MKKIPLDDKKNAVIRPLKIGEFLKELNTTRPSWAPKHCINILPANINNPALKSAWVNKWKIIKFLFLIDKITIIRPRFDNVEFAINFFKSEENMAQTPPTHKVTPPINLKYMLKFSGINRARKNSPAVTRVLL